MPELLRIGHLVAGYGEAQLTDDAIVLERGSAVCRDTAKPLPASPETLDAHLSV
jgi:hypothetical protein